MHSFLNLPSRNGSKGVHMSLHDGAVGHLHSGMPAMAYSKSSASIATGISSTAPVGGLSSHPPPIPPTPSASKDWRDRLREARSLHGTGLIVARGQATKEPGAHMRHKPKWLGCHWVNRHPQRPRGRHALLLQECERSMVHPLVWASWSFLGASGARSTQSFSVTLTYMLY